MYYPLLVIACFEAAARIMGCGTFYVEDYTVEASPHNAYIGDSTYGIRLNPGEYHLTLNKTISFSATHLENGTRRVSGCADAENPQVALLGCSYTYGYGVNDEQTFASLLQQKFPDQPIQNAGVIGYGTVQSLLQLKELIKIGSVKTVLLNFSSFHFMRNGLSPVYRSNLKIGYQNSSTDVESRMSSARFPYKPSCSEPINFESWENMYYNWPARGWLASVNWTQLIIDKVHKNGLDERAIAACLIQEMADLCEANGIGFGVVCLDRTVETERLHEDLGAINWLDIDFDFNSEALTNLPHEGHPSPAGHRFIAAKIEPFLADLLHEK
jgi:hypothetical protein